jgi:hypothetical protein
MLQSSEACASSEVRTSGSLVGFRLSRVFFSESKSGYRWAGLGLLAFFVPLVAAFAILGAPPVTGGPWDMLGFLAGGWRIVNGQIPHTDFHDPLGPLTFLLTAFGMKVATPSTASITYGSVLIFVLLFPVAWYCGSTRFSWPVASIFAFFEGLYLITPRPPGYPIRQTSYAMIYNRHGYVMLALLIVCVFLKARAPSKRTNLVEGFLAGGLLASLLYCKITYFAAGAAAVVCGAFLFPKPRGWLLAFIGTFAGVCVAFQAFLHISLYAYLKDIATAGHAQSAHMRLHLLYEGLHSNAVWIYLVVFCLVLCSWAQERAGLLDYPVLRLWLTVGPILAFSLWIVSGNTAQGGGVEDPMYFLAAVVLMEVFRRQNAEGVVRQESTARWAYVVSAMLLVPAFCVSILARETASCGYAITWDLIKRPYYESSRRMHSANLRDFYIPLIERKNLYWPVADEPERINEGIDMLRANFRKGDQVTTIAYVDPFSFALGVPPAKDSVLWWDLNLTFDRTHHPPAEAFLGHATLVMVLLQDRNISCCYSTTDMMLGLYGDYLYSHFRKIASNETWALYRRIAS